MGHRFPPMKANSFIGVHRCSSVFIGGKIVFMTITEKLASLKLALPAVSGPFGSYIPAKRVGNLIFVAGQLPMKDGKLMATGQVPSRCSVELAKEAARQCVINGLAAVQSLEGGVEQIV